MLAKFAKQIFDNILLIQCHGCVHSRDESPPECGADGPAKRGQQRSPDDLADAHIQRIPATLVDLSYRADGTRFDDARSQEPDIRIDPIPTYFIGRSDVVLDEAVRTILAADR